MNKKERQLAYERERKAMNDLAMREFDRERAIEAIHKEHIETIQEQIDGFYMRYAGSEGLTRAEAMKRADQMDVTKFANKAKKAVKEKDFSPETNEWLKTYNLKMKVSRLELLKEEINWELIQMYDKDYQLISESLREEARLELERQAGILGNSAKGARKRIDGIVNSDFYGKNFSERIWSRTGLYQNTQKEVFKSLSQIYATMDGYRNERNRLMDKMQTTEYETMRLLRTENARIGSQMQVEAYKENEFTHFIYVAEPSACDVCKELDGKAFKVEDAEIGVNLKPMHPNCYCSSYGYIAMERLIDGEWVDEVPETVGSILPRTMESATNNAKEKLNELLSRKDIDIAKETNDKFRDTMLKMFEENHLGTRVPDLDILDNILDSHFKNQMETGSQEGMNINSIREKVTSNLFGISPEGVSKLKPKDFEKYGYLVSKDIESEVKGYNVAGRFGDVVVTFKKESIAEKTTFTMGDSLRRSEGLVGTPIKEPSLAAYEEYELRLMGGNVNQGINELSNSLNKDIDQPLKAMNNNGMEYVELQYHGEVGPNDIESVTYSRKLMEEAHGKEYVDNIKSKLDKLGIKLNEVGD